MEMVLDIQQQEFSESVGGAASCILVYGEPLYAF
jgi:hypothetical protein